MKHGEHPLVENVSQRRQTLAFGLKYKLCSKMQNMKYAGHSHCRTHSTTLLEDKSLSGNRCVHSTMRQQHKKSKTLHGSRQVHSLASHSTFGRYVIVTYTQGRMLSAMGAEASTRQRSVSYVETIVLVSPEHSDAKALLHSCHPRTVSCAVRRLRPMLAAGEHVRSRHAALAHAACMKLTAANLVDSCAARLPASFAS